MLTQPPPLKQLMRLLSQWVWRSKKLTTHQASIIPGAYLNIESINNICRIVQSQRITHLLGCDSNGNPYAIEASPTIQTTF